MTPGRVIVATVGSGAQLPHTDVPTHPEVLPPDSRDISGCHLSCFFCLSVYYQVAVQGGTALGGAGQARWDTIQLQRGGMLLMVATSRHHGLPALPDANDGLQEAFLTLGPPTPGTATSSPTPRTWTPAPRRRPQSVDFRNAFPTMSHEMVSAALGLMCIPFLYIRVILHLLRAPYLYSVGKGYVPGVYHHPRAGTRQGDPLSPALFSLVASFVIFPLQDLGPVLTVMMYADDLIIFFDGRANPQLLKRVWEVVSRFGEFSGLKVNLNKAAAIVRNCGGMEWARCFRDIGVDVQNFVKYLGVRLGNIRHQQDDQGGGLTIEQAFAPALQEAFRRARVVSTLQLSMNERAFMLTSWILPVVAWVSKAYYAPVSVIRQLKLV